LKDYTVNFTQGAIQRLRVLHLHYCVNVTWRTELLTATVY